MNSHAPCRLHLKPWLHAALHVYKCSGKILSDNKPAKYETLFIFIICTVIFTSNLDSVKFHPDETYWIFSSIRLKHLINRNFQHDIWDKGFISYDVRPIPSYLVALGYYWGGINTDDIPDTYWRFDETWEQNISANRMPSQHHLYYARIPMAVLASLSFFMMTILTIKTGNRLAGYLFLTLTYNHYFLLHLRRAMTESSLLFFSTIFVFVLYMMLSSINNNTSTKLFYWASALGIVVGLAGQSKLNGLACGIAAFVALVLKLLHMPKLSMKRRFSIFFTTMTLSFFTTIVSFIGSYPFLYEEPFRRTGATFLVRYTVMQSQSENTYDTISAHERPGILLNQIFRHPLSIAESNWGYATSLLLLIITLYGIACFTSKVFSKNNQIDLYISIYATSLILAIPPLFTPLNWDRYYLYPVIFSLFYMTTGTSRWVSKCLKVPVTRLL